MKTLPQEETSRLLPLLQEDDTERDHKNFVYAFDILRQNWAVPYSIWPMPNADIRKIIDGQINPDDMPYEDLNEYEKGIFFEEQRQFIAKNMQRQRRMLCEARDYKPCLQGECPLFRMKGTKAGGLHGICSEYKIAFRNG